MPSKYSNVVEHFYHTSAWRAVSKAYKASKYYICERCGNHKTNSGQLICHHIQELNPDNIHDVQVTLHYSNLECICLECHNALHAGTTGVKPGFYFDKTGRMIPKK